MRGKHYKQVVCFSKSGDESGSGQRSLEELAYAVGYTQKDTDLAVIHVTPPAIPLSGYTGRSLALFFKTAFVKEQDGFGPTQQSILCLTPPSVSVIIICGREEYRLSFLGGWPQISVITGFIDIDFSLSQSWISGNRH